MIQGFKYCFVFLFFAGLIFQSCNRNDIYALEIKALDSLSGAVNAFAKESEKTDTLILNKAILRYNQYKQFIQQNITDTVSKTEADFIQQFYASGNSLVNFDLNRKSVVARIKLVNSQLEKLKSDAKNKVIDEEKLIEYTNLEKKQANNLVDAGQAQQKIFYTSLQEFKTSLKGIEALIKVRNNGQLPVVIKDTLSL
ncbi:MAG: hypothetical protein Q7W45_06490 [Bacteroidota bacterium]|nr:hypothetical protein [Bacteroidota bacterium]MDP3145096.1 hypothetical protein [Bacteroidota bacterium]MDP3556135.1 hypothetical protein [Bacteroidota bacterium]